jgi:hypothetical protein
MITIGSFRISQFYYSYSFVLKSLSKRLSIQYVYERVFLVFACFSKRVQNYNFFFNLQEKFKVFFETFFSSHLFLFLTSLSRNFPCFAGCKCNIRFPFSQAFLNLFLKKFFKLNSFACQYFCERLSLLRVQKYHLYLHLQAFLLYNFNLF